MGDESEWKRASTEEKCEHKNWKARLEGYEECCKLFRLADDPKNPTYLTYLGLVKKFVVDTNEVAKEKGLEAVLSFVENIPAAAKSVGEVMPGLINKCLNGRAKTRDKAIEIIMMYIEAEKQEIVQEELIKGLDNKQPKIVQSCLEVLKRAINEFSSKTIPIKPIIKFIPKLLEDRDKTVRDEAKLLAIEMYRWAGAAIMPQLQGIKPALLQELDEEFKASASGEKPRQTRFLRSQQDLKAKMEAEQEQKLMSGTSGPGNNIDTGVEEEVAVDPYDLMEPAEILSKLPKDFKEKIEAKKWQERKEVLEALHTILQKNPRLCSADYYELVNDLQKMVNKDANVVIVCLAAKCLTGIANGIRKEFSRYAQICMPSLMDRFKEKKQNIVDALREACDAIYPSTNLEAISETSIANLAHKTPVVRQQVALFLSKCFAMSTQTTLPKKVLKLYLPPLIKNLSEADPGVRESSAEALGAILKALGEKIFLPNVGELEQIKIDKIKEFAEKTVLLNLRGEPRAGVAAPAPVAVAPALVKPAQATIVKPGAMPNKKPAAPEAKKDDKKKTIVKGGGGGSSANDAKKTSLPDEPDMSPETVEERAAELFGTEVCNSLANANWKERQQAVETLCAKIKQMPSDDVPCQVIIRTLGKKPGFKDSHFQVLKQRLELVTFLADSSQYKFTQRTASYCLADIADKIGDAKNALQAKDALSKIAEALNLPHVLNTILPAIFEAKNPKNQENVLIWLSQAIKEFGYQGMDTKFLLVYIKSALANSNANVRVASFQLIATIYMYIGAQFRSLFDQEKPTLLEQIDAEIEKVKGVKPPVPCRGRNVPTAKSNENANGNSEEEENNNDEEAKESLIPRQDISSLLTESLMEQLNDKNWKERQAALEKLDQILKENSFVEPNLGEFPTQLNKRLTDTNKILATNALKLSEKLAQALGTQGKRYVSVIGPGMIQALSDNKEALRKTAVSALTVWYETCGGLSAFLESDMLFESFNTATNPNIKAELCGWLAQMLNKTKPTKSTAASASELKAIVPCVYAFVEDRAQEVRIKSQELILPLMLHVGVNEMLRAMQKAKPTSATIIQPLIEKARAELAARQPAPAPVAKPAPVSTKTVQKSLYDDDDSSSLNSEPAPPPAAAKKQTSAKSKDAKPEKTSSTSGSSGQTSGAGAAAKKKVNGSGSNKDDDEDLGPIMQISNKTKRMEEERALKTLKWNFDVPRKEFVEQLRTQIETAGFNRALITQLFHDDFKYHIIALNSFTRAIDENTDATISNLDLILRWLSLRFFETNPTVILKAIEYMLALFNMLLSKGYHLTDYEANAFVPYFIGKLGDPKDPIRKGFRQIIKQIAQVYPPVKVFNFLMQGLLSKNARQRAECLEELGQMIEAVGLNSFNPSMTLKEIAKQIADRDTSVRNAALNTILVAYQIAGEQVFKFVGKLNEKDQSMLDERIKRAAKQQPPAQQSSAAAATKSSTSSQSLPPAQISNSNSLSAIATNGFNNATTTLNHAASSNNISTETRGRSALTPKKQQQMQQLQQSQSYSSATITKHKGEFSLDLKDDDDDKEGYVPVKLTPHQDLDELLNQPIGLPPPRKNLNSYPISILKETQDCKEAIDLVITHISHQKLDISFQNLVQIDVVIKDREKKDLLIPHIDNLLNTCAVKLNVAHNVYLNSHDCAVDEVFKLFKGLFSVILDTFEYDLGKYASVKTLKDVIYNLLCVMIDSKILNYPDGDQLVKAINIVTLKLLELSNQTTSFCALVKLLNECCDQEANSKFLELTMKCVWRQIRRLSNTGSGSSPTNASTKQDNNLIQQIDTAKVLLEIHTFLRVYPSITWQTKQSDLPLRTVKTLLYHLAKAKQSQIIDDLNSINVPDDSEIKTYITKLFKNGFNSSSSGNNNTNNNSFGFSRTTTTNTNKTNFLSEQTSPTDSTRLMSTSTRALSDQLSSIIKKISCAEQSKEGLRELYDFKQEHPDIDINKYFRNSSGKLQAYIQENMKLIELERNKSLSNGGSSTSSSSSSSSGSGISGGAPNGMFLKNTNSSNTSSNTFLSRNLNRLNNESQTNDFKSVSSSRNVDDIMKTIADWKSKTQLNKLDDEDNDENNLRTPNLNGGGGDYTNNKQSSFGISSGIGGGSSQRLFQLNGNSASNKLSAFGNGNSNGAVEPENSIKAEKYLDIVKDLKKKYTRSRTESDQLSDLKQLDLKAKNLNENSASNSNLNNTQSNEGLLSSNPAPYAQMSSENLYDEYKRRLELIKKIKPINTN